MNPYPFDFLTPVSSSRSRTMNALIRETKLYSTEFDLGSFSIYRGRVMWRHKLIHLLYSVNVVRKTGKFFGIYFQIVMDIEPKHVSTNLNDTQTNDSKFGDKPYLHFRT